KTAQDLTGGRVTVIEDTLKPGFHLARHYHKQMVEIFYILEGEIRFQFDDETVITLPGMTINIPPNTWHDVICEKGGKLITIFSPGGFDLYLQALASMTKEQFADAAVMTRLAEKYDTWMA
ncbi:MAG: cupin domain-containing protein, partial [Chloroflexota bacterium]|nr:cupin domain-containing protein [Chloroflexota bacterium]